jgi:hypothetical protein
MKTSFQPQAVNLSRPDDIVYWSKKWEISPNQLFRAIQATQSNSVPAITKYLRDLGFAL